MPGKSATKTSEPNSDEHETREFRWPLDGYSEYLDEAVNPEDRVKVFQAYVLETREFPDNADLVLTDREYKTWATNPALTRHEFICLIIGRVPQDFDWEFARHYVAVNDTTRQYAYLEEQIQQSEFQN